MNTQLPLAFYSSVTI